MLPLKVENLVVASAPVLAVAAQSPPPPPPLTSAADIPVDCPVCLPLPLPLLAAAAAAVLAAAGRGAHLVRASAALSAERTSRAVGNQRRSADDHAAPVVNAATPL